MFNRFIHYVGMLRAGLFALTVLVIACAPFADGRTHLHDWRLFPGVIAPAIMMMLVFALPLDMTMSRIFMLDAEPTEVRRLRTIVRTEIVLLLVMVVFWLPFMLKVLDFTPFS